MKLREIEGKPSFKAGDKLGYFLWKDDKGIHLMWTTTGRLHGFNGKISGDNPLKIKEMVKLESNDLIVQPDPKTITWKTRTSNDLDGVIFETDAKIKLELLLDSAMIGRNNIYCGRSQKFPENNPFYLEF